MEMRHSFETKVHAAFAAAVLVVAVLAATTWRVSQDTFEAALQVSHTKEVLERLAKAKGDTLLIESLTRGYIISGDAEQLAERDAVISEREKSLRRIKELTANNARQQERWMQLREAADARLAVSDRAVQIRATEGFDAARVFSVTAPVRETRERYFRVLHEMEEDEIQRLEKHGADWLRVRNMAVATGALTSLILIALLSTTFFLIRRQFRATEATRRALELANARIGAILDTVAEGVITIDERGNVETLNPAAERVFGYAAAEVVGRNIKMLMPEPYHSQHDKCLEHYRTTGKARIIGINREVMGKRKDGSTFPMELAVSEMRLGGERHYTGIARDISERKQAESQFNRFFELSLDMMCISSADGYFKRVSPAFTKTLGWSTEEILARPFLDFVHPDDNAATRREVERQVNAGESVMQFENRYLHKDGSWCVLSWRSVPQEDGLMFATARDITRSKETEQTVVAAKNEAEEANAAKDIFLATMSHEIRTPLNGLLGMLELLGLSGLSHEQRRTLEIACDSGRGLVRIIDDVLDHAKIEAGKLEIRLEPVSMADLLRRVLDTYHAVASAKDLTLRQAVDPRISPWLLADPLRTSQILNNLVSNALKFTTEGYVEVCAELLEHSGGADTVRLSVEDTGIGIDPEMQQRLFQPFEQAGAVTARLYGGTGLGLSISRRLAEMMGGAIEVNSAPGKGTTMSVTLTLPVSDAVPVGCGHETTPAVGSMRTATLGEDSLVLAVDDHPTNRELLARQIATLGLRVQMAAGGREALALWKDGEVALVVTDCNMPEMDGYALSRAIREIEAKERRPRTPIIAWTANVLPGAAERCRAAGMDDTLTKPAGLAVLKETLSKWLPSAAPATVDPDDATNAGSGASQVAPIDLAALNKIAVTAAEQAEILLDFMTETRSDLAALHASLTLQDLPDCARIAHRMKGSSKMVGALDLAAACETVERAARRDNLEDVAIAKEAIDRAREQLEAHLVERTGANEEQK